MKLNISKEKETFLKLTFPKFHDGFYHALANYETYDYFYITKSYGIIAQFLINNSDWIKEPVFSNSGVDYYFGTVMKWSRYDNGFVEYINIYYKSRIDEHNVYKLDENHDYDNSLIISEQYIDKKDITIHNINHPIPKHIRDFIKK